MLRPANDTRFSPGTTITFDWTDVRGAASYTVHVEESDRLTTPLLVNQTLDASTFTTRTLPRATMWWRARANDGAGSPGGWSPARRVRTDRQSK